MPLISLNPLFCLWNCFLLLPWLIGHLASSKKTNGNVREGKDTLHATWPVPVNISLHTQYTFLYSCALNAHTLLHVLKLLFFFVTECWCLIFSNEPELFSSWPPTMYLGIYLQSCWLTTGDQLLFGGLSTAVLKFTHPPLSNLWDTICEDCNLCGTKFSVARAGELNRTSSPPGTASSQWAMSEDLDKEQKIPMCLRVDLCFSACGGQGPVICASPREYSALKVPQEARSSQSQWLRNNILNFTTVVDEVTADRKRAAGNPSTSSQSSLRHTHINT